MSQGTRSSAGAPLTNGQFLMWTGQQLIPDVPCYNMMFTFAIDGELSVEHMRRAFQALIDRSDVLRTVVVDVGGVPEQQVLDSVPFPLELVDLAGDPDPEAALRAWVKKRAGVPLRLDRGVFDSALLELGTARFVWFLNVHHAMIDGWSYALLYREMIELYRRSEEGDLDGAPALEPYGEHVRLERRLRETEAFRTKEAFWRERLAREVDAVGFYGRSSLNRSTREHRVSRELGGERTERLRAVAAERLPALGKEMSLSSLFLGLVFAYVHRVSGNRLVSIGVPFHYRPTRTAKNTIGLYQETFPFRLEISEDDRLIDVMERCLNQTWEILRQAEHGISNPGGSSTQHQAAYDVMFNYPNVSFPPFHGFPTDARRVHTGFGDAHHSLFFHVHDFNGTGALTLDVDYNEVVFERAQQERATEHFLRVVDQFLDDPDLSIRQLDLLTPAEREQVLVEFNRTAHDSPNGTVMELFEEQVAATPDHVAAEHGDQSLTYRELNSRANRWAHYLRAEGVKPNVLVALCADRSLALTTAWLGILKAGGAYVPLDPTHPKERQEFIIDDARAPLLLTQLDLREEFAGAPTRIICIDDAESLIADQPTSNPDHGATLEDLAYTIYTSGSTGKPKGAAIPHRALVNVIRWQMEEAARVERPRTLHFTPLSFDVSLQETFATWGVGGTLVIPVDDVRRDPEALLRTLIDERIEQFFAIFTPLQQLAKVSDRRDEAPRTLRDVYTAGEQLQITPAMLHFFQRMPGCRLHNQYGSAEDLIVTAHTLSGSPRKWPKLPPIGRAIWNTQVYLLDEQLRPVPIGMTGDIYIGGAQVARGYLNRPELTAERFFPDTFSGVPGSRLYKKGDLARFGPDGSIDFLGRIDNQIKLRGYRIELGEIEAVLSHHPAVKEIVVAARKDGPDPTRLVAYVVARTDPASGLVPELQSYLLERLPEPMVPAAFVMLERIPTNANGKVDRLALPAPPELRPEIDAAFVPPTGEVASSVAEIWRNVLHVDRVGLHDNFFSLGGHSILLVEVHRQLVERFACRVSVIELFRYPTVQALSEFLSVGEAPSSLAASVEEQAARQRAAIRRRAARSRDRG